MKYLIMKYLTFRKILMYDRHFDHKFMLTSFWKKLIGSSYIWAIWDLFSMVTNLNPSDSSIGPDDGLALIRRHAFIWTNVGLGYRRIYASLGLNELNDETTGDRSDIVPALGWLCPMSVGLWDHWLEKYQRTEWLVYFDVSLAYPKLR